MKDTRAMEICVNPQSISAQTPSWLKPTATLHCNGESFRRISMQSWLETSTTDRAILRIANAPSDTQGATEPNPSDTQGATEPDRSTKPREINVGDQSNYYGNYISVSQGSNNYMTLSASTTNSPHPYNESKIIKPFTTSTDTYLDGIESFSTVGKLGPLKEVPRYSSKQSLRKCESADSDSRFGETLSETIATHSNQLTSSTHISNEHKPKGNSKLFQYSMPSQHIHPLTPHQSSPSEGIRNTRGDTIQTPRKPSNLSEIERQRGPLKKRHIHYQPDVLDLSVKRAKPEFGSNVRSIKEEGSPFCSNDRSLQSVGVGLNTVLKQEHQSAINETGEQETGAYHGDHRTREVLGSERPEGIVHVGGRNQDMKEPIASGKQGIQGNFTFSNIYRAGSVVGPPCHNDELVRRWVLHVTQNKEMHDMQAQHLQTQVAPDLESNHSSAASDASQGSMASLPSFNNAGTRGQRSTASLLEKPYACNHCSSKFKHRHHVIRHMRAHNGERPFHCQDCGAAFARKCVLTNHRRTHTGEKPYICTECGDTFSRKHHLVIHQRTHSGEKPYHCMDCGAAFARSHHVNRHRRTHEKSAEEEGGAGGSCPARSSHPSDNEQLPTRVPPDRPSVLADAGTELASTTMVPPSGPSVLADTGTQPISPNTQHTLLTFQPSKSNVTDKKP